jgi:hypothetical protein
MACVVDTAVLAEDFLDIRTVCVPRRECPTLADILPSYISSRALMSTEIGRRRHLIALALHDGIVENCKGELIKECVAQYNIL